MSHDQVLLIEDDVVIAKTLTLALRHKGYDLTTCDTVKSGRAAFEAHAFDFLLIDINLPDGNGLDLCRSLREQSQSVPILILTANVNEETAVQSLEGGADDYVRKPFGVDELVARMQRLRARKEQGVPVLRAGCLLLDPSRYRAWAHEVPLNLGHREFEILMLLIKKAGDVVSREAVLSAIGHDADIYDRTIDSHLSHLRRKLKQAAVEDVTIQPVYGVGYRLEVK
jgi:DNA-binding response OmpR family regulator